MRRGKIKWAPILEEDEIIKAKLNRITDTLEKALPGNGYSLYAGNTGVALLHYYNWLYTENNRYLEKGNDLILEIFGLNYPFQYYSLCSGTSGFMWAVNHLINNKFIEGDCSELFSEKEHYLFSCAENDMKEGKYDFLHNAIGAGLYFMKRNDKQSIGYVESLILALEKTAEKDTLGLKWRSTVEYKGSVEEVYNTSLSHGMTSIVAFLSKAYKCNILKSKVKDLIYGAVCYLLSLKADIPNFGGSFFPSYFFINKDSVENASRLAWCYGDLGIGIVLWQASQILQNKEWEKIAIGMLLQTTSRKDPVKESVNDAGICHGTAGIAHIYNRMYHYTGIETFRDSAIYWLHETLNKSVFEDGLAGYKAWHTEKYGGWTNEVGILEGIAGIGLVFLAAISNIEPKWDECFFLS
jgi:lantibiotic biosynthesis protein